MLGGDVTAIGALAVLLVLPALVLVRVPWCVGPVLSAAFWIVSSAWMGLAGGARGRFLHVVLGAALVLGALRALPKWGTDAPRYASPAPDAAAVRAAGLLAAYGIFRFLPLAAWPMPPGTDGGFRAAGALLTAWHDGPPAALEPFYPVRAGLDGASLLAADVLLLSSAAPERAIFVVAAAAEILLALAAYAGLTRVAGLSRDRAGAAALLAAACGVPWPGEWAAAVLAVALAAASVAVLATGSGRSGPVASGVLAAAAVLTGPLPAALGVAVFAGVSAATGRRGARAGRGFAASRVRLALLTAATTGLPVVLRPAVDGWSLPGAAIVAVAALSLAVVAARGVLFRRTGPLVLAAGLVTCAAWVPASGRTALDAARLRTWRAAAAERRLLDRFCAPPGPAAAWVPAVTGRATEPAVLPSGPWATGAPCVPGPR
jgi:hypothetical protein